MWLRLLLATLYKHLYSSFLAQVTDVQVYVATPNSVEVSWTSSNGQAASIGYRVIGYQVYYNLMGSGRKQEETLSVHASRTSIPIEDLLANSQYMFQVSVLADIEGDIANGLRSDPIVARLSLRATGGIVPETLADVAVATPAGKY